MIATAETCVFVDGASCAAIQYAGALISSVSPCTVSCTISALRYPSVISSGDSRM